MASPYTDAEDGVENVEHSLHVHIEGGAWEFVALQQPKCRELKDPIGIFQGGIENIGLGDVAAGFENLDARIAQRIGEIFVRSPHEIVVDDNFANITLNELVNGMRADQSGAADHNKTLSSNVHFQSAFDFGKKNFGWLRLGRSYRPLETA
jgi:hypothetical protein